MEGVAVKLVCDKCGSSLVKRPRELKFVCLVCKEEELLAALKVQKEELDKKDQEIKTVRKDRDEYISKYFKYQNAFRALVEEIQK
ncbi:hypothetical protein [Priestia megaterium]|uniref:hypothetical protein n=1 Tax=Priestia megaterium TaxID=1404 RepID=UPI000BECE587|nr:hypothetical protein [Priestia megaterium]PED64000.1 hypothetical protein CON20_23845 [Priestia megaterium]